MRRRIWILGRGRRWTLSVGVVVNVAVMMGSIAVCEDRVTVNASSNDNDV